MKSIYQEIGKEEIKTGSRTKNWNEAKWIEFIETLINKDRTEQSILSAVGVTLKDKNTPKFEDWLKDIGLNYVEMAQHLNYTQKMELTDYFVKVYKEKFNL